MSVGPGSTVGALANGTHRAWIRVSGSEDGALFAVPGLSSPAVEGETGQVPFVLKCKVTRRGPGPCFLHEDDARAALGSSEFLEIVSDWATGHAVFPPSKGLGRRRPVTHIGWRERYAREEIRDLMADFHAGRLPSAPVAA